MAHGKRHGTLELAAGPVPVDVPAQLGGPGEGSNPEELLVASAAACYGLTLASLLERAGLVPQGFGVEAEGVVSRERGLLFKQMVMRPKLTLGSTDAGRIEEAERLCAEAAEKCFIARTLRPTVPYVLQSDVALAP